MKFLVVTLILVPLIDSLQSVKLHQIRKKSTENDVDADVDFISEKGLEEDQFFWGRKLRGNDRKVVKLNFATKVNFQLRLSHKAKVVLNDVKHEDFLSRELLQNNIQSHHQKIGHRKLYEKKDNINNGSRKKYLNKKKNDEEIWTRELRQSINRNLKHKNRHPRRKLTNESLGNEFWNQVYGSDEKEIWTRELRQSNNRNLKHKNRHPRRKRTNESLGNEFWNQVYGSDGYRY